MTLPTPLIRALGLSWLCLQDGTLADGTVHLFDVYSGVIHWDGHARSIEIEEVDAEPLIGMALLRDFCITADVIEGGAVSIRRL